jgi:hypothetical protein
VARTLGDGGWSWFGDPRAVFFAGLHRRTYVGWVSRAGEVVVASFDHRSRHVERFVLRRGLSVDDHNSPGLLMGDDGHLTVYYTAPRRARMHYRRMTGAEDVTRWESERTLPANTPGDEGYTYPNPLHLRSERQTYLFWRGDWWPAFSRRLQGGRWTPARTLLRIPGQRPYLKLHGDGERSIHIAYTEGNPGSFVNSLYYLRLGDDALHRADGARVARLGDLPLAPSRGDRVYDARASGVRAWVWDVAVRRDGRPVIVYVLLADGEDPVYMYAGWDGVVAASPHRRGGLAAWQLCTWDLAGSCGPERDLPLAKGWRAVRCGALAHGGWRCDMAPQQGRHRLVGRRRAATDPPARAPVRARRAVDAGPLHRLHGLPHGRARAPVALVSRRRARGASRSHGPVR